MHGERTKAIQEWNKYTYMLLYDIIFPFMEPHILLKKNGEVREETEK